MIIIITSVSEGKTLRQSFKHKTYHEQVFFTMLPSYLCDNSDGYHDKIIIVDENGGEKINS